MDVAATTSRRCGLLVAWTASWLAGHIGPDEVMDAVTGDDSPHQVGGLGIDAVPLLELLLRWRRNGATVRLVLPVPGDVRGVPGPSEFRAAALESGAAVCGGDTGAVAEPFDFWPSSAPPSVLWRAFPIDASPADHLQLSEVQYELVTAIRESASVLGAADVAGGGGRDVGAALRGARRAGEDLVLPPGFPPRAVALLAQAERMQAVLDIAAADPSGGAVDRHGMTIRRDALRPLEVAVRRALLAGYNAASLPS